MHYSSKLQDSTGSDLDVILQQLEASGGEEEGEPPSGGSG